MKALALVIALVTTLLFPSLTFSWHENYICTSRYGPAPGYGRLSKEGEYSDYWNKHAEAGEFVIFQYKPDGKKYWFLRKNCKILKE
jgi:hypothetical protein